jgi:hypothetical protein
MDFFVVPMAIDIFSIWAIRNIGNTVGVWQRELRTGISLSLEFRVRLAVFRQRSLFDRAVCSFRRPLEAGLRDVQAAAALRGGPVP